MEIDKLIKTVKESGLPEKELQEFVLDVISIKIAKASKFVAFKKRTFKNQQIRRSKARFKDFMDRFFNEINNKNLKNYGV
jgi:hypothetical protein